MFKSIAPCLFSFDLEWIPDPLSAKILHGVEIGDARSDEEAMKRLWREAGATEELPQPYLKTVLCRIVSVGGIFREVVDGKPKLKLVSLPNDPFDEEKAKEKSILSNLLKAIGTRKPQLVGYNSHNADVPIIVQRAIVNGLLSQGMAERPDKPWEGVDYFSQSSDYNVDMAPILGKYAMTPKLHEIATLSGIPGKVDTDGGSVPNLWLQGKLKEIVDYNEFDAMTTHLLWARIAHFGGLLNEVEYALEQESVRELMLSEIANGKSHFARYIEEWDRLQKLIGEC
ncbi:3'-5' exonuclease [Puniceicoccaceae bacterium K14]|nr:3'-5' exonuclease [Puniceicoccaceae bacterium K14]